MQLAIVGPPKSQIPTGRRSANCIMGSNPTVQAAAGSGIAAPTDASSVIQAAAFLRMLSTGEELVHLQACQNNGLVILILVAMAQQRAISTYSTTLPSLRHGEAQIAQGNSINPAESSVRITPMGSAPVVGVSNIGVAKPVELDEVSASASEMKMHAERDRGAMELNSECHPTPVGNQSKQKVDEHQNSASCNKLGRNSQGDRAALSDPINQTQGVQRCWQVENNGKRNADGITAGEGIHEETTEIAGVEEIK